MCSRGQKDQILQKKKQKSLKNNLRVRMRMFLYRVENLLEKRKSKKTKGKQSSRLQPRGFPIKFCTVTWRPLNSVNLIFFPFKWATSPCWVPVLSSRQTFSFYHVLLKVELAKSNLSLALLDTKARTALLTKRHGLRTPPRPGLFFTNPQQIRIWE